MKIAILISGRGSNMQALCAHQDGFSVCLVASDRPAEGLKTAKDAGCSTGLVDRAAYANKAEHEAALAELIERHAPDWIILAGYMSVLSASFIERFDGRIINIHPSLLPDYKGLNTHARALADGRKEHGVSVHLVTAALDDGPLLAQVSLNIQADDTQASLSARVLALEHQIYPAVITALAEGRLQIRESGAKWSDTTQLRSVVGGRVCYPPPDGDQPE